MTFSEIGVNLRVTIPYSMSHQLRELVFVDSDKCVNCHACISVCPVKFCNNGSGDAVTINHQMCLGCGNCIDACSHGARYYRDDWALFAEAHREGKPMVAIVAPAVAASFPDDYLRLNTLLRKMGVEAVFDVSFGAELTVHSYLQYAKESPQCIISQPCPALVSYIEIYRPELIRYLAPADSPMLHTIKMVKTFYPQYKGHQVLVVSPCLAKRREFDCTGYGDFNVTLATFQEFIEYKGIDLAAYPETPYDNPPAERAVLFSSPGGLLETALREVPDIAERSRKIEGPDIIYKYFDSLAEEIELGRAPFLIDCLNCTHGCNGGTGTQNRHESFDKLETFVKQRSARMKADFAEKEAGNAAKYSDKLTDYWQRELYVRKYVDRSANNTVIHPSELQLADIFGQMKKFSEADVYNCSSCGYGTCHDMAVAIHNNLNRIENCHHYKGNVITEVALGLSSAITEMTKFNDNIHRLMDDLSSMSSLLKKDFTELHSRVESDKKLLNEFDLIAETIANIAYKTDILAINAAIEAARAGEAGRGFNIVADEVKRLSVQSGDETEKIKPRLGQIETLFRDITQRLAEAMPHLERTQSMTSEVSDMINQTSELQMDKLKDIGNVFGDLVKHGEAQKKRTGGSILHRSPDINLPHHLPPLDDPLINPN